MKWRARLTQKILDNGWSAPDGLPKFSYEQVRVRCFKHAQVFEWTTSAHTLLHANKGTQGCRECYRVRLLTPDAEVMRDTVARGYQHISHEIRDNRLHVTYTCGLGRTHTQGLRATWYIPPLNFWGARGYHLHEEQRHQGRRALPREAPGQCGHYGGDRELHPHLIPRGGVLFKHGTMHFRLAFALVIALTTTLLRG